MPVAIPAVVAAAAVFAGAIAAEIAITYALVMAVIAFGLTMIQALLAPKPKIPSFDSFDLLSQDRTHQVRQAISPWCIIYGEVQKSGPITYMESTDGNKYLHFILTLCSHEVQAITTCYFNDIPIYPDQLDASGNVTTGPYANRARIRVHRGNGTAQPFPGLVSESNGLWTNNHRQTGHAKAYVRLQFDRDVYQSIPNIKFKVKGKKIFDTRTSSTLYSLNPALCIRDFMVTETERGGMGFDTSEFTSSNISATANVCDEFVDTVEESYTVDTVNTTNHYMDLVGAEGDILKFQTGDRIRVSSTGTVPGGLSSGTSYYCIVHRDKANSVRKLAVKFATTYANAIAESPISFSSAGTGTITVRKTGEPRYTCQGVIVTSDSPVDSLEGMRLAMAGYVVPVGGQWVMSAGAYTAPTISFDEDDFTDSIEVQTKVSRRSRFNAIKGVYISPLNNDQASEYPFITNTVFEEEDGGKRVFMDLDLPFTTRANTAQRIAKIELFRHRRSISAELKVNLAGMQIQAGDTLQLSYDRLGWVNKVFQCMGWTFFVKEEENLLGCSLAIQETDSNVYDWNSSLEEQLVIPAPRSNLPSIGTPTAPTNLQLDSGTAQLYIRNDGTVFSRIRVSWTAPLDEFVLSGGTIEVQFKRTSASEWDTSAPVPGDVTFTHILDVEDGVAYDVRVRSRSHLGFRSGWLTATNYTVIGKTANPTDVTSFNYETLADGTRRFTWTHNPQDADVKAGGGYKIRYATSLGHSNWNTMLDLHEGIIVISPFETNELSAGEYTFAIKAEDSTGNQSNNALFIDAVLPDPRLGESLFRRNERAAGWDGDITDGFVSASGDLIATGSGTINDLPATISGLAATIIGMSARNSPMVYTTDEIDLGIDVTFRPLVSTDGTGTITVTMQTGTDADGSATGSFVSLDTVTARYIKIRASVAGTTPILTNMIVLIDAPTQTETFEDVDTSSESESWFSSTATGDFRIGSRGNLGSITQAYIVAIQNAGPGYTWELITKSTQVNSQPAAHFRIYSSTGGLANATVDIQLRGPRVQ